MFEDLAQLREEALSAIGRPESLDDLEKVRIQYLGRKGSLTSVLRGLSNLPMEVRPKMGETGQSA